MTRRDLLQAAGAVAGAAFVSGCLPRVNQSEAANQAPADYSLRIAVTPVELAPNRIVAVTTYNGQFPGPLLRLRSEERRVGKEC